MEDPQLDIISFGSIGLMKKNKCLPFLFPLALYLIKAAHINIYYHILYQEWYLSYEEASDFLL